MKKKLIFLISLGIIALLILLPLLAELRFYIGWGESRMDLYYITTDDKVSLMQLCETGIRQYKLGTVRGTPVFSPNGRYAAVCVEKNSRLVTRIYDMESPRRALYALDDYYADAFITDDGLFVYHQYESGLYCHSGVGTQLLDAQALPASAQLLENTVYYFRKADGDNYDLYACDLPDGTPRRIGEDLSHTSLQVSLHEGRHYIIAARETFLEGSLYDTVIDDAGAEKDELRETLKSRQTGEVLTEIYRFVDGETKLLASGVRGDYRVEPVTGTVICRFSAFLRPVQKLSELENAYFSEKSVWYAVRDGVTAELSRDKRIDPVITPEGEIFLIEGIDLLRWSAPGAEAELVYHNANNFRVLLDENGGMELYVLADDRSLHRLQDGKTETITHFTGDTFLPAEPLPGGANRKTGDAVYYKRAAATEMSSPGPVTMVLRTTPYDLWLAVYRMENGEETHLLTKYGIMDLMATTLDGRILMNSKNGWYLANGEDSSLILTGSKTIVFPTGRQLINMPYRAGGTADTDLV